MTPPASSPPPPNGSAGPAGPRAAADSLHALLQQARARAPRDPQGALALLDGAGRDDGLLHHARGALLARLGRVDDAVAALERAVAALPDVADVAANLGAALLQQARAQQGAAQRVTLERARALLHDVVARRPLFADAGAALVLAHELLGDTAQAVAAADANLQRFPEDAATLFNRASALRAAGQRDAARATLQRLVAAHPDFAPAQDALRRLQA
ncbi:MAG: tetratricopeptide repeat protein [Deltaproteobacteria bacterium]|nr:tetratricopeptide repeat protein [Deltaproteobacteria bacterium]